MFIRTTQLSCEFKPGIHPERIHQGCNTHFLMLEATHYLEKGLPANTRLVQTSMKPSLGWLKPYIGSDLLVSHEYQATYHGEANPDQNTPKGWGSKSSPPTSSNIRSITGAVGLQVCAMYLRVKKSPYGGLPCTAD